MANLLISDDGIWYLKTGLDRAIRNTREALDNLDKRITRLKNTEPSEAVPNEYLDEMIRETEAIRDFHRQWLTEAVTAYLSLPTVLQPAAINEEW